MKRIVFTFLVGIFLFSFPCWGANLEKGLTAARLGDFATALREFTPLAREGNAEAQTYLGALHASGQGVPRDYKEAVRLFRLAAEQGNAAAQNALAVMHASA